MALRRTQGPCSVPYQSSLLPLCTYMLFQSDHQAVYFCIQVLCTVTPPTGITIYMLAYLSFNARITGSFLPKGHVLRWGGDDRAAHQTL